MLLREFLKSCSRKEFAKRIGKDKRYIDNLLYGARPSRLTALEIERASNGLISRDEALFPELYQSNETVNKNAM